MDTVAIVKSGNVEIGTLTLTLEGADQSIDSNTFGELKLELDNELGQVVDKILDTAIGLRGKPFNKEFTTFADLKYVLAQLSEFSVTVDYQNPPKEVQLSALPPGVMG
jgi:hypothetical protein